MTDFLGGYTARWSVREVDRDTWADKGELDGVVSVGIDRSSDDEGSKLESGSMELTTDAPEFRSMWCRLYMTADQDGMERVPMATLLFERSASRYEKGTFSLTANGRSVLQPAADIKLAYGAYAPAGCDGAAYAAGLVAECTPAPVSVEGSFTLVDDLVFDIGSSRLEAAWKVLNAAGWCMQIDGEGRITVRAKPTEPSLELSRVNVDLLIPGIDDEFDISGVPNRYIAVDDGASAMAVNEEPASAASYPSRGRYVDFIDTSPVPVNGENLELYAARKLGEVSTVTRTYSYTREFWPDVVPYSIVRATLPETGLAGDLRVISQQLECGKGVTVAETAGLEVRA